jgi:hypothetical protein
MDDVLTENTKIFIKEIAKNYIKNNYEKYISNNENINELTYPRINLESFINFFIKVFCKNISSTDYYNESYIKKFIDDYIENK